MAISSRGALREEGGEPPLAREESRLALQQVPFRRRQRRSVAAECHCVKGSPKTLLLQAVEHATRQCATLQPAISQIAYKQTKGAATITVWIPSWASAQVSPSQRTREAAAQASVVRMAHWDTPWLAARPYADHHGGKGRISASRFGMRVFRNCIPQRRQRHRVAARCLCILPPTAPMLPTRSTTRLPVCPLQTKLPCCRLRTSRLASDRGAGGSSRPF